MAKMNIDVYQNAKGELVIKNLEKDIQRLNTNLEKTTRTSNLLGTALKVAVGYLGARQIYRTAEAWAKLSGVQSIAEQQLKQAMISSGRYSDQFLEDTLKMAKGLQQILGIGDEFIIQGQKMLISFARIPEELIPRVTKAMVDLSAFTGRTMEQSARIFGKASLGMTGELRRLAIPIDKATFAMKGFEGVLEQVEHHVQDQVMAIREGYGAWKAYADQIKEVKERAGDFINALAIDTGILEDLIDRLQEWNAELLKMKDSGQLTEWAVIAAKYIIGKVADITYAFETLYDFIDTKFGKVLEPFIQDLKGILTDIEKMALAGFGATVGGVVGSMIGPVGMAKGIIAGGAIGYNWGYLEKAYDKVKEFFMGDVPTWFNKQLLECIDKRIEFYQSRLKYLRGMEKAGPDAYSIGPDPDASNQGRTIQDYINLIEQLRYYQITIMQNMAAPEEGFSVIKSLAGDAPKKAAKNIHELSEAINRYGESLGYIKIGVNELPPLGIESMFYGSADTGGWQTHPKGTPKRPRIPSEQWGALEKENQKKIRKQVLTTTEFKIDELLRWYEKTKETYQLNEQDFSHLTSYKEMMLSKYYQEGIKEQEKAIVESKAAWLNFCDYLEIAWSYTTEQMAEDINKNIGNTFSGLMVGAEADFGKLGESIARTFANTFSSAMVKKWIAPITDEILEGTASWWQSGLMYGAMGYGMGGYPGALGSMAGGYLGGTLFSGAFAGPAGALAGGLLGGLFDQDQGPSLQERATAAREMWADIEKEKIKAIESDITASFSSAMGQGFLDSLETGEYQTFKDTLSIGLADTVKGAMVQMFTTAAMQPLLDLMKPAFQMIKDYQFQTGNPEEYARQVAEAASYQAMIDLKGAETQMPAGAGTWKDFVDVMWGKQGWATSAPGAVSESQAWNELTDAIKQWPEYIENLKSPFEMFSTAMGELEDTLVENTGVIMANTAAILGPVESFLRELTVGQYAPALSLEGMQAEYAKLYESAYFDPDAFSEFASFAKSGYLDFMKAYGGYGTAHAGVISDVQAFPWVQDAYEKQAQEQRKEPIYVENHIDNHIDLVVYFDGQQIASALANHGEKDEDFTNMIRRVANG